MSAYIDALKMLGRRELSETQVRQRLARKGHEQDDIDTAVVRLRAERAIDDSRVAEAIARTQIRIRRRGRIRVKQQIQSAGISGAEAKRAIDEVFGDVDEEALLDAALAKRLKAGERVQDDRQFQRLYRYLASQGFESDRIVRVLNKRKGQ
jgi:regulatory protein